MIEGSELDRSAKRSAGVGGPCVEVSGGGFDVEGVEPEPGEKMEIRGLAITGAGTAINVINKSTSFIAENDWIGVKLDGTAESSDHNSTGIFLDPESDGATIGGLIPEARNVIANSNNEGLDIQGASAATVVGNYFGVEPDGSHAAANGKDIEVTSSAAAVALGNEIGGVLSPEAVGTPKCDGACNVISGAQSSGIDLLGEGGGEEPPPRSTLVYGNYIGLAASGGGAAVPNVTHGIQVGKSHETSIGGGTTNTVNRITGGLYGVFAGSGGVAADDLVVDGNAIGVNAANGVLSPPAAAAIIVDSAGLPSLPAAATISANLIVMGGGEAIQNHGPGAFIEENLIFGGLEGIRTFGFVGAAGNTIKGNSIKLATEYGVLIENDSNIVAGNEIANSGSAGIHVGPKLLAGPASGNLIGGSPAGENTITGSEGAAIEIVGEESKQNQVARNNGAENAGLFIDLAANGVGNPALGPNLGIQAPAISAATPSGASGTAEPGATVTVFRKATSAPGEIASFLGQATADGSGNWSLSYGAAVPNGTPVAAIQTTAAKGSSELALATSATPPEEKGGGGGGGAGAGDTTPPQTKLVKAPKAKSHKRTAKFKFTSSEAGSTFECKLDGKPFKSCRSPKKYKKLKPGKHVFKVRAVDKAGNKDRTPATRKFRVLP